MFKKLISAALSLLLIFPAVTAFAYTAPEYIKVGLNFGSDSVNEFSLTCEGSARIGHTYEYNFYPQTDLGSQKVLVEKGGGAYLKTTESYPMLTDALANAAKYRKMGIYAYAGYIDGENYLMFGLYSSSEEALKSKSDLEFTGLDLEVINLDTKTIMVTADDLNLVFRHDKEIFAITSTKEDGYVSVNGSKYYGYMLADRINSSAIAIVNMVSFDDYVACVVGSEMYPSWHIEALKAQAVIARTYAMTTTSYKKYGIDVTDDTRTQAYKGISAETASTRKSADETSGIVVLYNDSPAQTYFCSSSGNKTADVYSAWGGGAGLDYLVSVENPYEDSSISDWKVELSKSDIESKLTKAGANIGELTNIVVTDRGDDGRVRKLRFDGTNGSYSVSFEKCRTILGLKSQYYTVTSPSQNLNTKIYVITSKETKQISFRSISALSKYSTSILKNSSTLLSSTNTSIVSSWQESGSDLYKFIGSGNGHGIGLSQYGAKGMAEAGYSFDQILSHYYPGTTLSK